MDATSGLKYLTQVELEGYSKEKKESHEWLKENEKGKGMFFLSLKISCTYLVLIEISTSKHNCSMNLYFN